MAEQKADTSELESLRSAMKELQGYCEALQGGAAAFVYILPNEWQGPASANFLALFGKWSIGAAAMGVAAGELEKQVKIAKEAYELVDENMTTSWNETNTSLS